MKVLVQGDVHAIFDIPNGRGSVTVTREYELEFRVRKAADAGGEVWEWAQRNWDIFIPRSIDVDVPSTNHHIVSVSCTTRWFCITAVLDAKTKEFLPIVDRYTSFNKKREASKGSKGSKGSLAQPVPLVPKAKRGDNPVSSSKKKKQSLPVSEEHAMIIEASKNEAIMEQALRKALNED